MAFGLDPQGLEAFPHDQRHDDDHDGYAAHASRASLWGGLAADRRLASTGAMSWTGGRSWDQVSYSVHPTTPPFVNDSVHSPKGCTPPVSPPIMFALCWRPA